MVRERLALEAEGIAHVHIADVGVSRVRSLWPGIGSLLSIYAIIVGSWSVSPIFSTLLLVALALLASISVLGWLTPARFLGTREWETLSIIGPQPTTLPTHERPLVICVPYDESSIWAEKLNLSVFGHPIYRLVAVASLWGAVGLLSLIDRGGVTVFLIHGLILLLLGGPLVSEMLLGPSDVSRHHLASAALLVDAAVDYWSRHSAGPQPLYIILEVGRYSGGQGLATARDWMIQHLPAGADVVDGCNLLDGGAATASPAGRLQRAAGALVADKITAVFGHQPRFTILSPLVAAIVPGTRFVSAQDMLKRTLEGMMAARKGMGIQS